MIHRFIYILTIALCGCLLSSCVQEDLFPEDDSNDIVFRTNVPATRVFLSTSSLATEGSELSVIGTLNGTAMDLSGKTLQYKSVGGTNRWTIVDGSGNPLTYYWIGLGNYKFYAWLKHDAAGGLSTPNTWTYDATTKKLTVPTTIVNTSYNQFDFLYSNVDQRIMDESNFSTAKRLPVSLQMNHLMSAFAVGIRNTSEDDITVKEVSLYGIHETGSAEIDYSGTNVATSYNTSTERAANSPFISYRDATGFDVPSPTGGNESVTYNVFSPTDASKHYYMVWPQAAEVLSPTNVATNPSDDREYLATDSILYIEYAVEGNTFKKRLKLPNQAWEAGKMNYIELQMADKMVVLTATVKDWEYFPSVIDFADGSILVKEDDHLIYDPEKCIVDATNKKVYVKNGQPVEGKFTIDAPTGAQWRVSLEGDVTAFKIVDDTDPAEDGIGPIDGAEHTIHIVPLISNPERDYSVRLKFVVITADGKILPADDMIQDNNNDDKADPYTIILQKA